MKRTILILSLLLAACGTATPTATPVPIRVAYTQAVQPWLASVYACAGKIPLVTELVATETLISPADLAIRIGMPANLTTPAYRIGTEEILVVVNRDAPVTRLTPDQVKGLFSGQIQDWSRILPSGTGHIQVWVFPPDEDVQSNFSQSILEGMPVTSQARLAGTLHEMAQAVARDKNAVGILPRHGMTKEVTEASMAASVPVLAITPSEASGEVQSVLTCLQK